VAEDVGTVFDPAHAAAFQTLAGELLAGRLDRFAEGCFAGTAFLVDALRLRKVLAEEFFQSAAAVGERDLLFGLVPTDLGRSVAQFEAQLVQPIKTSQISHLTGHQLSTVVFAPRVVDHSHVGHKVLSFRAALALARRPRHVETHVRAGARRPVTKPTAA